MSQLPVSNVSYMHITKDGHCAFCGSKLRLCLNPGCGKWFHATREDHVNCKTSCRKKKSRDKIKSAKNLEQAEDLK